MSVYTVKYGWYNYPMIECIESNEKDCSDAYHDVLQGLGFILCQDYDWIDFYKDGVLVSHLYDKLQDYYATDFND